MAKAVLFIYLLLDASLSFSQVCILKGVVKHEDTLLVAATVSLADKTTISNSKGEFSIGINPGIYVLSVTYAGYKKFVREVVIKPGEIRPLVINMIKTEQLGEVVVLGSRSVIQRRNLNTPVPVDRITSIDLKQTGQHSLIQMMNFTAPSFNVSRQNLFEPVTLRGLGPDHLLILLNGTRYHNTAYVNTDAIRGTLGLGAVGNDVNSIPFSAIEKIEILRDGASAQYGSDAVAGVMNIELKKTTGKTLMNLTLGQHYMGDGETVSFGINRGISLGKGLPGLPGRRGFLNFSGDFRNRRPTHRGGEYEGTVYKNFPVTATREDSLRITAQDDSIVSARGFSRKTPVSNDGSIQLSSLGFLINGGYSTTSRVEFFWTGSLNYRYAVQQGLYRFPKTLSQVNTELFPDGFKPEPLIDSRDISAIAGARGKTNKGWNWEWNSVFGENSNKQLIKNTNNASQYAMGANAPTEFYGGKPVFIQQINSISFAKDLAKNSRTLKSFTLGFGAEYRFENFHTRPGEEASWKDYDSSGLRIGGVGGSINPEHVVNESRHVTGVYIDLETDLNDHFLIDIAGRVERYNDFGNNFAGKLAMRYKFSPVFSLRGSASNGYHAPAIQQIHLTSAGFSWKNIRGVNTLVQGGIFSNNSAVSQAFGIKPMQAEKAINLSSGFTSILSSHLSFTADAYWIQIKKRIVLSGIFYRTNPDVNRILAERPDIDQVQFLTNAINTRTRGVDIVMNGNWRIRKAKLGFMAAANFTRTNVFGPVQTTDKLPADSLNSNTLFDREQREKLERSQPASKIILLATYKKGKTAILIRSTRFGKTSVVHSSVDTSRDEFFSAKILTDLNFSYTLIKWVTLTAGVNNIFDVYPDRVKNPDNKNQGMTIYSQQGNPYGFNGGYYFVNMAFNF